MKVAVSIPDRTFSDADALAKRLHTSRSALYARALDAFIKANDEDPVTVAMNAVVDSIGEYPDEETLVITRHSARVVLASTEW